MVSLKLQFELLRVLLMPVPVIGKGCRILASYTCFFEDKGKEIRKGMIVSRLQVLGKPLKHPLKVANVVVRLNLTGMLAPIFALVPVVHFLFPPSMSWSLDLVLMLAWAPVGWSSPGPRLAPLPGGVR